MDGYDERSYGDAFADVYDDWYADLSDVDATVDRLLQLADGSAILELGVGTGRIAVPLAEAGRAQGVEVTGVDTSEAMLDRLRSRDHEQLVTTIVGDMSASLPSGAFGVAFVAFNTLFNLPTPEAQRACFAAVAAVLQPAGCFVVEAFVPDDAGDDGADVSVRTMTTDRVVLSVSTRDTASQRAEGHFIEFSEVGGVRLRPWSIRYSDVEELDSMAAAAGFVLERRTADFGGEPFGSDAERHVSIYRLTRSHDR